MTRRKRSEEERQLARKMVEEFAREVAEHIDARRSFYRVVPTRAIGMNKDREQAVDKAVELATSVGKIADALLEWQARGVEWAARHGHTDNIQMFQRQAAELRSQIRNGGEKEGDHGGSQNMAAPIGAVGDLVRLET